MFIRVKKGQSVAEYSIFMAAVIGGLIGLQVYFQRAVKGNYKERSDAVGSQFTTTQNYTVEKQSSTLRSSDGGYLEDNGKKFWSKSKILNQAGETQIATKGSAWLSEVQAAGAKLTYSGNEVSKTDYVDQSVGTGAVGSHGTFDSGTVAKITPWEDAGIE